MNTEKLHASLEERLANNQNESRLLLVEIENLEREKLLPELNERYLGKFFKTYNSYNSEGNWFLYQKVINITGTKTCEVFKFQTDIDGTATVSKKDFSYLQILGLEIPESEFNEAFSTLLKHINP